MRTYRSVMALVVLLASPAFAQSQRRDNPTVKETLRWMQTSLESGSGDLWVGHEVRSLRLDDFVGCRVHFSASTHQEPFANGEPAPDKKPTRIDYFFELGDIDPANIAFSKGPDSSTEVPSIITIRTQNDEKKITSKYSWQPEADAKPDDTFVIFTVEAFGSDNDYVVRFARAFKHAVEACGGKPSLFADSHRQGSDERAPLAAGSVAARSASPREDIPAIAKAANGAVVSIVMSDKDGNPIAQGSGFLVSKDGLIVTNYHVIAQGTSAVMKLPDGAFFVVDGVLAFDKARDLAVIKAHGENLRTVTLGNSDRVEVGQEVVAIGNPLSLESTVSNGIVSGIRTDEDRGGKFLQITTPISPGSSGGPLFNMAGEVIGITTMYLKGGENLNFAIPINDAKRLLLAKSSKIQPLPEEPEQVNAETPDAQPSSVSLSGRDYYKQWYAAGGIDEVPPNSYVCFPDDNKDWPDVFFVFKAYALENNDIQAVEKTLKEPYIEFVPSNIASILMSPAAQEVLHQGGRIMNVQTYSKGVQTGDVAYYWDKNIQRWETHDRFQTSPDFTSTIQLVIEPKTLRYVRFMHATSSTKSEDTDILSMDSGACEAIPAKR